jgi:hypothetical protein
MNVYKPPHIVEEDVKVARINLVRVDLRIVYIECEAWEEVTVHLFVLPGQEVKP